MCDTLVATGSVTKSGNVIFAKNSDREPNEPQVLIRIPRKRYDMNSRPTLRTTYLEIEQAEETNEVVISKPSQMWGCEMGFNEYSVAIGNEAVFTKEKHGKDALTGMDMVRLALERTKTAKEAVDYIIFLLGRYGQGGNCGYAKKMRYHNSFIAADRKEAYVLETAGKYWVKKKISGFYAISNGLTIENDFDSCHPSLIKDSVAKKMCKGKEDFNFRKLYSDPLYTKFSGSKSRMSAAIEILGEHSGETSVSTMVKILQNHQKDPDKTFYKGSMSNICMHAGSVISSQTTASVVGELKEQSEYWYTASSLPCVSVFKPFVFNSDFKLFSEDEQEKGIEFWSKREELFRMMLTGQTDPSEYKNSRDETQRLINEIYGKKDISAVSKEEAGGILRECAKTDNAFVDRMLKKGRSCSPQKIKGGIIFKRYWSAANAAFKAEL